MNKQGNVMKTRAVFEIIVSWVKCDFDERKGRFDTLLKYIDFSSMDARYVKEHVLITKLIQQRPDIIVDICKIEGFGELCNDLDVRNFKLHQF